MIAHTLVTELPADAFEREVLQSPGTVLLEFRAAWCPPCNYLAPVLEQIAAQFPAQLKIFTVDIEQNLPLARQFNIQAVPTLVVYRGGQLVHRQQGAPSKPVLLQLLGLAPQPAH